MNRRRGGSSLRGGDVRIRHALIIAAGEGMRFGTATHLCPKPLLEVAGVPIIQRVLLSAREAGIDRFTVVTGYCAEVLEDFLSHKTPEGITVECIRNDRWRRPNGLSVLTGEGHVPDPFVLLMADHLFDAAILRKVLERPPAGDHCRLAVDLRLEKVLDLEDATKVLVEDGRVTDIGKNLKDYNAVDTGIFLCTHGIFNALRRASARGRESLSDGIRELALHRRMEALPIGDLFWQDIDTEYTLEEAEKAFLGG
jgi:choline kinase